MGPKAQRRREMIYTDEHKDVGDALEQMTDEWISDGNYCDKTVMDLRDELKRALSGKTLTCVYCGMVYPLGTPPHGTKILTDHIKICEKHPMRNLQSALEGLVGASSKIELEAMELVFRTLDAPEADKVAAINAIHVLLETI